KIEATSRAREGGARRRCSLSGQKIEIKQ
ncbi:hypothetical protein Gorai_009266, partial [Gossypium raimondii]|nr:hypothetical protein [Gossypium raimondii]